MTQIPRDYDPKQSARLKNLPVGTSRIRIESARVEKDKYDKLNQRENVLIKGVLVSTGEVFYKRLRVPISWSIPGAQETEVRTQISGRQIATMLELVGAFNAGDALNATVLDGKEFMWEISHYKNVERGIVHDNIDKIYLPAIDGSHPGEQQTNPPPPPAPAPSDYPPGQAPGAINSDSEVPF